MQLRPALNKGEIKMLSLTTSWAAKPHASENVFKMDGKCKGTFKLQPQTVAAISAGAMQRTEGESRNSES